ncbi:MAG: hypothetical protein Q7W02_11550 [Candidatus Rokubacteria bacterium]|nr:hypothetical protein [Candidatus Rokubacteria bacterium]
MMMTRGRMVVLGGLSLYLLALGFGAGMASERIGFDRERTAVLHRYDDAVRQWHGFLMAAERRAEAPAADGAQAKVVR